MRSPPAVVDRPCPGCGGPTAVLLERGRLVLACRTCPDPEELVWSPRKARRSAATKESSEKAASEKAAADQRLQSRCGSCGGAQQRWKVVGGYVHLCAAWPACGGVAFEAGRGAGVRRAGPPLQAGGPAALTSIVDFRLREQGVESGNAPLLWKEFSKCKRHHRGAFSDRQDIDTR